MTRVGYIVVVGVLTLVLELVLALVLVLGNSFDRTFIDVEGDI